MLQRLYAALSTGPAINCRPHQSRQRVDLAALARLDGSMTPEAIVKELLSGTRSVKIVPKLVPVAVSAESSDELLEGEETPESPEDRALAEQQSLLRRLRNIAEDARAFEQDTGAHALHVGFPLLHLPPGQRAAPTRSGATKRILAPVAFIPVTLTVKVGRSQSVLIEAAGEGADLVQPNTALLAWIEQQTQVRFKDLFQDDEGKEPWREVDELVAQVAKALELAPPPPIEGQPIGPTPRSDEDDARSAGIVMSAVLGLYPLSNQSLLRDVEAMSEGDALTGPVESFLRADASLAVTAPSGGTTAVRDPLSLSRVFSEERFVTDADPCQARAVRLARTTRGLVIHGPPGTGKSQTIANIIGDHLARGERVLFVCDKRTALDVVHQRIAHIGLGQLCAVVHDAQRDQRDLYMGIRDQLDALSEAKTDPASVVELEKVDRELDSLHAELTRFERALHGSEPSFHGLAGRWLELEVTEELAPLARPLEQPPLAELSRHERAIREVLDRSLKETLPSNPWRDALAIELGAYLARPLPDWKGDLAALAEAARRCDDTGGAILPFGPGDVVAQGTARSALWAALQSLRGAVEPDSIARWARALGAERARAGERIGALATHLEVLERGPLDAELAAIHRSASVPLAQVIRDVLKLMNYVAVAPRWWSFLAFEKKKDATQVLARFGLPLDVAGAERVLRFLEGVRARALATELHRDLASVAAPEGGGEVADDLLRASIAGHRKLLETLAKLEKDPSLSTIARPLLERLGKPGELDAVLAGLAAAEPRARAIAAVEERAAACALFASSFRSKLSSSARAGEPVATLADSLVASLGSVEGILRLKTALATLPAELGARVVDLAAKRASPDEGARIVERALVAAEMGRRLQTQPALAALDADSIRTAFERFRALEDRKRGLVRAAILTRWTIKQKDRLLAATGSRLNSAGAELKRRLMLRGERALKVRPMIAAGANAEGGDPLFDARPVWMASPHTVAQIFPRAPIFDVLVFDEASQCRLEEALPVLMRAKRVVIAGDPKQLPPTRFFESAVAQSANTDADLESEQGLFEEQQSEIEDLLGAALNLEVEQSYLDVHYRSRNADLIAFSNESFYDSRLQPIPGHPSRRAVLPPLRLIPVGGVYEKRTNPAEARKVVEIVRDLLGRAKPPSIGIACMNVTQRDAIREALDEAAATDAAFAAKLAEARVRTGAGSFEGLFVKNLENVQGDERDHMIVSTTYGPDAKGRFYRRFGPLGASGGGRRLNVLVTRARDEVHLVTSIPADAYRGLEPVETGRTPNGGWLLFAYLKHAEELAAGYVKEAERLQLARVAAEPRVTENATPSPSVFARSLARELAKRGQSSQVHWGNAGFCVDVALAHPTRADDVTVGILCDSARFERTRDKIEWDMFRTRILEQQGWRLVRVWTPRFFRDPQGALARIVEEAGKT